MGLNDSIVFLGSGPVAAASLENLISNFSIEVVITKRRAVHHKDPAPVEELAKAHKIQLAYADNKNELEQLIANNTPASSCGVVIDYGVIISQPVIDSFARGIVNSHFSILPQWRGADPITFSLLSGQKQTGVSLMLIDAGLDTGDIIAESYVDIAPDETNSSLTTKLIELSNSMVNNILPSFIGGEISAVPQSLDRITTYSRKLTKQDGVIDVTKPASVLEREIRAYSEWPKSKLHINDQLTVILSKANVVQAQLQPGEIQITTDNKLLLGTRVGSLEIIELMPLGRQKMSATAFLNGYANRLS